MAGAFFVQTLSTPTDVHAKPSPHSASVLHVEVQNPAAVAPSA
jgi:hypothetical protein